ncbi:BMC domain-containing protein [Clostridium estertheticum]|nr:BMC domain-containing protein [Clostridium estertheticum]WLC72518.1 BMC domain-containing protein [Clostridium estertheticum]
MWSEYMIKTLGILEFRSIAKGIEIADVVLKAAEVELVVCKTICPGKYMIFISGEVGAVNEALDKAKEQSEEFLISSFLLPSVHEDVANALKNKIRMQPRGAIGIVETTNVTSGIFILDKALKSANVNLFKIVIGMAIGGKSYFVIYGDVSSVKEAVKEALNANEKKNIVYSIVIPSPSKELIKSL